jgi:hypothetical protein
MDTDSDEEEGGKSSLGEEEEEEATSSISGANTEHVDVESHVCISSSPVTGRSRPVPQQALSPARLPFQRSKPKSEYFGSSQSSITASSYPVQFVRYVCVCVCVSASVSVWVWVWV